MWKSNGNVVHLPSIDGSRRRPEHRTSVQHIPGVGVVGAAPSGAVAPNYHHQYRQPQEQQHLHHHHHYHHQPPGPTGWRPPVEQYHHSSVQHPPINHHPEHYVPRQQSRTAPPLLPLPGPPPRPPHDFYLGAYYRPPGNLPWPSGQSHMAPGILSGPSHTPASSIANLPPSRSPLNQDIDKTLSTWQQQIVSNVLTKTTVAHSTSSATRQARGPEIASNTSPVTPMATYRDSPLVPRASTLRSRSSGESVKTNGVARAANGQFMPASPAVPGTQSNKGKKTSTPDKSVRESPQKARHSRNSSATAKTASASDSTTPHAKEITSTPKRASWQKTVLRSSAAKKRESSDTSKPSSLTRQKSVEALPEPTKAPELTKAAFQGVIDETMKEIRAEHEKQVRLRLQRARNMNEQHIMTHQANMNGNGTSKSPTRKLIKHEKSPFEDMKPLVPDLTAHPRRNTIKLGQRFTKTHKEIAITPAYTYTSYKDTSLKVPPYTSYISTKHNILVEDDKHRTSIPYLGDDALIDQDYMKIESKLTQNAEYYERLNAFVERANQFLPFADELLERLGTDIESVLSYLLDVRTHSSSVEALQNLGHSLVDHLEYGYYSQSDDSDAIKRKKRTTPKRPQNRWRKARSKLGHTYSQDKIDRAAFACSVFLDTTGVSLWHVVKYAAEAAAEGESPKTALQVAKFKSGSAETYSLSTYATLGCLICKGHECPGHGEFEDKDDEKNLRHRVNHTEYYRPDSSHRKTLNPLHAKTIHDAIGLDDDEGIVSGALWSKVVTTENDDVFADTELCSDDCFWSKSNRRRLDGQRQTVWQDADANALQTLRPAYDDYRRAPCMIAATDLFSGKSCFDIFRYIFDNPPTIKPPISFKTSNEARSALSRAKRAGARREIEHWLGFRGAWRHHEREPFLPCNHAGPCSEHSDCDCYRLDITCEKSCACADNCRRKFQGCLCGARNKACYDDEQCECNRLNRECDPDLCRSCGAHEALDPVNRHNTEALRRRCANVYIQRGVPKRTLLGHSKMMADGGRSGWGLYMGEPCKKDEYIGEYVGEVVTTSEAEQRGIIYDKRNMSYLFDVNRLQTLDSTLVGNKLRFINHQPNPLANVKPRTMFCNAVQRIGMYATRDIDVGQELFFDYGPDFASKVSLIVQGQAQTTTQQAATAAGTATATGGSSKRAASQARPTKTKMLQTAAGLPIKVGKGSSKPVNLSKNGRRVGRPPKYNWVDPQTFNAIQKQGGKATESRKRSHASMLEGGADEEDADDSSSEEGASSEEESSGAAAAATPDPIWDVVVDDSQEEASPVLLSDDDNGDADDSDEDEEESVFDSDDAKQRRKRRKKTRKRRSDFGVKKGPRVKRDVFDEAAKQGHQVKKAARKTGGHR